MKLTPFYDIYAKVLELLSKITTNNGYHSNLGQAIVMATDDTQLLAIESGSFQDGSLLLLVSSAQGLEEKNNQSTTSSSLMSRDITLWAPIELADKENPNGFFLESKPYMADLKRALFSEYNWRSNTSMGLKKFVLTGDHVSLSANSNIYTLRIDLTITYVEAY